MANLLSIEKYVKKTARIIASVLDMEVLICNDQRRTIEDTHPASYGAGDNSLGTYSILEKAMKEKSIILLEDRRSFAGCASCPHSEGCDILSIVAFPIVKNGSALGGIGIYADDQESRKKLLTKKEFYIEFIQNMSELLVSKLEEHEQNLELYAFSKRLSCVVEAMDVAVLSLDESGSVISCNSRFYNLFQITEGRKKPLTFLRKNKAFQDWMDTALSDSQIPGHPVSLEREFLFSIKKRTVSIQASLQFVDVGTVQKGIILYFRRVSELYETVSKLTNHSAEVSFDHIIGESDTMIGIKDRLRRFAKSSSTILLQGESGTGKDIFARAIHNASGYRTGPFVSVNCAAIPENLLESEFFGYEEGAFTGAVKGGRVGKFELANKGTLFLDEIGELPLYLQPKLLRAIQDKKIQRVGSNREVAVDLRIIAATNRDLEKMMERGEFREDLYYRLNVIPVNIPPLRYRQRDIVLLLEHFLGYNNRIAGKNILGFSDEAGELLREYAWPGNVREMQNVVEYAVNISQSDWIGVDDLPQKITKNVVVSRDEVHALEELEKGEILKALSVYGKSLEGKERSAAALGISRATLYRKMKEYGL